MFFYFYNKFRNEYLLENKKIFQPAVVCYKTLRKNRYISSENDLFIIVLTKTTGSDLKIISSYLGLTAESLSRLRKELPKSKTYPSLSGFSFLVINFE